MTSETTQVASAVSSASHLMPRSYRRGTNAMSDRAEQRQERDDREDADLGQVDVHLGRPYRIASARYAPAMTTRPIAMPSA